MSLHTVSIREWRQCTRQLILLMLVYIHQFLHSLFFSAGAGAFQATSYQDGYTEDSETVKDFWAIADSLDGVQKKKLLMFVTGEFLFSSRDLSFSDTRHGGVCLKLNFISSAEKEASGVAAFFFLLW